MEIFNTQPIVSVIIPTYNRRHLIYRSIQSVLNQTFTNFELLVVDDGSQDNTWEEVKTIQDSRIRYFYKKNGGVSSARNFGLNKIAGEFVAFLDSDDEWDPDFLRHCVNALKENPDVTVAYGRDKILDKKGKIRRIREEKHCKSGYIFADLFESFFALIPCSMIRRSDLDGLRFDVSLNNNEDVKFQLALAAKKKFIFVPEAFMFRHYTKQSLSRQGRDFNRLEIYESIYREYRNEKLISRWRAYKKFAEICRSSGKNSEGENNIFEAYQYYKKGLLYRPFDMRIHFRFLKLFLLRVITS